MANVSWIDASGNWTTAADWSTGTEPGAADDVTIATGDPQVTTNVPTVNSVADSSELDLKNGGMLTTPGGLHHFRHRRSAARRAYYRRQRG